MEEYQDNASFIREYEMITKTISKNSIIGILWRIHFSFGCSPNVIGIIKRTSQKAQCLSIFLLIHFLYGFCFQFSTDPLSGHLTGFETHFHEIASLGRPFAMQNLKEMTQSICCFWYISLVFNAFARSHHVVILFWLENKVWAFTRSFCTQDGRVFGYAREGFRHSLPLCSLVLELRT